MDGFRFDLASCLCRDPRGVPLSAPPLIRDIANDPVLSKVLLASPKMIARPFLAANAVLIHSVSLEYDGLPL